MSASNWRDCPNCGQKDCLREDYEFYWDGFKVVAEYGCSCDKCDFIHNFRHESPVEIVKGDLEIFVSSDLRYKIRNKVTGEIIGDVNPVTKDES